MKINLPREYFELLVDEQICNKKEENKMKVTTTGRGVEIIENMAYPPNPTKPNPVRLVQQSSAVGNYDDAMDNPGSSYLWIDENHHLNREEVKELVLHLQSWLDTGNLSLYEE